LRSALAALALVALKCAVSAWALHIGFTHVSDDDFARVTLAQAFAHAPQLDPTGTSWLPFPFWLNGGAMALFGRSLAVARGVAVVSSALGALLVYGAVLRAGVTRWAAWCGVAIAMCTPWSVWLGVATVPEALCASLIVFGAVSLAAADATDSRPRFYGSVALLAASLSRYEAWPVALVFALACAVRVVRNRSRSRRVIEAVPLFLVILGPAAWIAWNAHAHGDPFHFLARVAAYRVRMTGAAASPTWTIYPEAFVHAGPHTMALTLLGIPGLLVDASLRRRWAWPLASMAALVLFLAIGDLQNGAPTHHPERALLAVFWTGSIFGIDGARSLAVRFVWGHTRREAWLVALVALVTVPWACVWPSRLEDFPARSASEDRSAQLARGDELRRRGVAHLTVTPCAYEHFALIAGFEAPERVTVLAERAASVVDECPHVDER